MEVPLLVPDTQAGPALVHDAQELDVFHLQIKVRVPTKTEQTITVATYYISITLLSFLSYYIFQLL